MILSDHHLGHCGGLASPGIEDKVFVVGGRSVGGDGRVLYLRVILDRPHAKPNISNMRKYTHGAFKLLSGLSISIYRPQTISNYERIHLSQVNEVLNHFYSLAQLLDDDDDGQK